MGSHRYTEVDVFATTPYRGNALAVVHDAATVTTAAMQRFAAWTNLSETVFLLPPTHPAADYRVRIFTTTAELPFAGHPTLGAARAWLDAGGTPRTAGVVVQECAAGLVPVRRQEAQLAFAAPPLTRYEPVTEGTVRELAALLGLPRTELLDAAWLVNGPQWLGVRLASAAAVLALRPDPHRFGTWEVGVVGPHPPGSPCALEVRAFVGGDAVFEDPVTGSLQAGLARWLTDTGHAPARYTAAQGTVLGRAGRVHLSVADDQIWVGGHVSRCISGTVDL